MGLLLVGALRGTACSVARVLEMLTPLLACGRRPIYRVGSQRHNSIS